MKKSIREQTTKLSQKLNWTFSYVKEEDIFPKEICGKPYLAQKDWSEWSEPFKISYTDYVTVQTQKEESVEAVRESFGRVNDYDSLSPEWKNALKLYGATFPLAEFAATIGNLRAVRFGRDSAWRNAAVWGGLDELRHTQIPLTIMSSLVKSDEQFDWTHKFYHTNNWVAIAARHIADELLLMANPIEFAIGTNFVFETGFTNLQFIGLSATGNRAQDRMFEKMVMSIQSDEARHAQIGPAVLEYIVKADKNYAQYLIDKWFWRSWKLFAVVTGFSMDYLSPINKDTTSFKEFVDEWVLNHFLYSLEKYGLQKPWYWPHFIQAIDHYHHMLYAGAYTYRSTVWFDFAVPSPERRAWLLSKYPESWPMYEPLWQRVNSCWEETDVGNDFGVHGTAIVTFCSLCQMVLAGGTPKRNSACQSEIDGETYMFCSEPCKWLFEQEPERYKGHKDIVKKVLKGEAPGNVVKLIRNYFKLDFETWGKDIYRGNYPWLNRNSNKMEG